MGQTDKDICGILISSTLQGKSIDKTVISYQQSKYLHHLITAQTFYLLNIGFHDVDRVLLIAFHTMCFPNILHALSFPGT